MYNAKMTKYIISFILIIAGFSAQAGNAIAVLKDKNSNSIGIVEFEQSAQGVLANFEINGIKKGWHAIHVHEKDDCSGDGFKTAGGHANAHHASHGFMKDAAHHVGDMPNLWAHKDGSVRAQAFLSGVKISDWLDADGAAVILHEADDDYASQPSGAAGPRIACGSVIK